MKIKLNRKYIDTLGNISLSSSFILSNGIKSKKKFTLTKIDNIHQKTKIKISKKLLVFDKHGVLEGVVVNSPFNPIKRFYFFNNLFLIFKRFLKKVICDRIKKNKEN